MTGRRTGGRNDVQYYVPGRKRPVAGSTVATSDFLGMLHEMHPGWTVAQLRAELADRSRWIFNPEANEVLDAHVKAGRGDWVPQWR